MDNFKKNVDELYQENINSIKTTRRQFYPRNFELSEDFVNAFKAEYRRLAESGQRPKALLEKINKALKFHV
jgi:hypothetical protein